MTAVKLHKIGDLARLTGKTPRALRLYEELGLLVPRNRSSGGFRLYGPEAISRIDWVEKLQSLGLSLNTLALLLGEVCDGREGKLVVTDLKALFRKGLAKIDAEVERLAKLRHELDASLEFYSSCEACTETDLLAACRRCDRTSCEDLPLLVKGLIARAPAPKTAEAQPAVPVEGTP